MKNYGDLGGCYPPRPTASTHNTLLDLHNSSYDTQPHSLIVKYSTPAGRLSSCLLKNVGSIFEIPRTKTLKFETPIRYESILASPRFRDFKCQNFLRPTFF